MFWNVQPRSRRTSIMQSNKARAAGTKEPRTRTYTEPVLRTILRTVRRSRCALQKQQTRLEFEVLEHRTHCSKSRTFCQSHLGSNLLPRTNKELKSEHKQHTRRRKARVRHVLPFITRVSEVRDQVTRPLRHHLSRAR